MTKATAEGRPSLAGVKVLVEEILSADDDGKVMKIGDRGSPGTTYALKTVDREGPEDDAKLARCRASAEASLKLGHPSILKYHDYRDRRSWFRVVRGELLMEYVPGVGLDRLKTIRDAGRWTLIFKHVAGALAHMHRRGVIHGDLTPRRVLLARSGAVKVIGYGQSLLAMKGQRTASKKFAAPEQLRGGALDEKTDIYAVGAWMYQSLTGKSPNSLRERPDDDTVKLPKPSSLNAKVPAPLDELILSCVQRHPPNRPEGMFDVFKALEDLADAHGLDDGMLKGLAQPEQPADAGGATAAAD